MLEWYNGLEGVDITFFYSALIGGIIFLIKFIIMLLGADGDVDFDFDGDDAEGGVLWISTFSLAAFFMMFGLGGLTASLQFGLGAAIAVSVAIFCGLAMIVALKMIMKNVMKLHSSGNVNLENAVGVEGAVYLRIPATGQGKVQLTIQGTQKVMDATSETGEEISTGDFIVVTGVVNNVLKVKKQTN